MKQFLIDLIGEYTPIQVSDNLSLDIPFIVCGALSCVVIYCILRGVISICKR